MGFNIFMTVVAVAVPLMMAVVGLVFTKAAPKTINPIFGYRTTMSMKNEDTWQYAHAYCGRIWLVCGLVFAGMVLPLMAYSFSKNEDTVGLLGAALCALCVLGMVWSVILTERALKEVFDENGERRAVAAALTETEEMPTEEAVAPTAEEYDDEEAFFEAPVSPAVQETSVDDLLEELEDDTDIFGE